ncbi:DUF4974 domain-containing protein [Mucilaginibacter gynuensis]|uniref:DUF4974 domain-containing protein n=1 Tax=Mucilaginibacter gynuensis TaxID=1302236 RepID=A0ABP8FWA5_9SPHI
MEELNRRYFLEILKKYRLGTATAEEVKFLEKYYDLFEVNEDQIAAENEQEYDHIKLAIKQNVDERVDQFNKQSRIRGVRSAWVKYAVAASVLVFCSIAGYFMLNKKHHEQTVQTAVDINPGGNKAVLTLANGKKIVLDDIAKGEIAKQGSVSISKTADGRIVYTAAAGDATGEISQNVFSTPKGGQYQVVLPDGTTVLLNAASSLTYPSAFTGNQRLVTLTGEAYFEVTKNKAMPFRVKTGLQTVEVLGTHFNINAYPDESVITTTLAEGSVKVSVPYQSVIIIPGQQAVAGKTAVATIAKHTIDLDKELAWKNGVFSFENDDIRSVMRQIARWYDVNVAYEGVFPADGFNGEISRDSKLSEVIKILEYNNVDIALDGKNMKVSYKASASKKY